KLEFRTLVPGHGKSGPKDRLLRETRKLLADLCAAVRKAKAEGKKLEEVRETLKLEGYRTWPAYEQLLPVAIERLWSQELPEISVPAAPAKKPAASPAGK
ncbi:MAG: hypothetical protein ACYTGB_16160, partial [Planctomycetota bacterium]